MKGCRGMTNDSEWIVFVVCDNNVISLNWQRLERYETGKGTETHKLELVTVH